MSKISVIIPTYNRAHLLNRTIQSVLNQTFHDLEIIIVDDASTDGTEELIKNFNDSRILYFRHEKNKGGSATRNTGIKHASGEFVAFLDSDDEWLPEKLEKQMEIFDKAPKTLGVVYTAFRYEGGKSRITIPKYRGNIFEFILVNNCVGTASTPLIKKECFIKTGIFDEQLPCGQDWDLWIRLAQHYEFDFLREILVRYYPQSNSISMDKKAMINCPKMISKKYEQYIKNSSKRTQAKHYLHLGRIYWRNGNINIGVKLFSKSLSVNILVIEDIFYLLIFDIRSEFLDMLRKMKKALILKKGE
jgi:glycosyltransferase involved in cell wall biosynthesis